MYLFLYDQDLRHERVKLMDIGEDHFSGHERLGTHIAQEVSKQHRV